MTNGLSREGRRLLELLLDILKKANPDDPQTFISYKEAHRRLGLQIHFQHPGRSLQEQGLNALADWIHKKDAPAITGLVVSEENYMPGRGFFDDYQKDSIDVEWWLNEIRKAKTYDWSAISENPGTPNAKGVELDAAPFPPETEKVLNIAMPDSKFFLKSEYGPFSNDWPVLAFTHPALGVQLQRDYRTALDYIVITGTAGRETQKPEHRARLLSIVKIDKTKVYRTRDLIPAQSWKWADDNFPNQWMNCFKATGWQVVGFPSSTETIPGSYSQMGRYPYRGKVLELTGADREAVLNLSISRVFINQFEQAPMLSIEEAIQKDKILGSEALRISSLVFGRVSASDEVFLKKAPTRTAPMNLTMQVAELLRQTPLICMLCGGLMQIKPKNRLLQPSPDRIDSKSGDYGPNNFQLTHLACNLGKNAASVVDFKEWLELVRDSVVPET